MFFVCFFHSKLEVFLPNFRVESKFLRACMLGIIKLLKAEVLRGDFGLTCSADSSVFVPSGADDRVSAPALERKPQSHERATVFPTGSDPESSPSHTSHMGSIIEVQ